jgi:hypothetical protein
VSRSSEAWLRLPLPAAVSVCAIQEVVMTAPETRVITCPQCGFEQYAIITYYDRAIDDDWDDGTCLQCAKLIISERCGSIFLVRAPETFVHAKHQRRS